MCLKLVQKSVSKLDTTKNGACKLFVKVMNSKHQLLHHHLPPSNYVAMHSNLTNFQYAIEFEEQNSLINWASSVVIWILFYKQDSDILRMSFLLYFATLILIEMKN